MKNSGAARLRFLAIMKKSQGGGGVFNPQLGAG